MWVTKPSMSNQRRGTCTTGVGIAVPGASAGQHRCGFSSPAQPQWGAINDPFTTDRVVDICLDRASFLARGWNNSELGRYGNGEIDPANRRGLFLSMFYALQMGNPHTGPHPWDEPVATNDRGLGAHIDHWVGTRGKQFQLRVWDDEWAPHRKGIIVGRNLDEYPFKGEGALTLGYYVSGQDKIFVRADYPFALGHRIDEPTNVEDSTTGDVRPNITYVIAHEMGHFFGFRHLMTNNQLCMMNPIVDYSPRMYWQQPEAPMNTCFSELRDRMT